MTEIVVWLHAQALRMNHPAVLSAGVGARVVFVWDDAALRRAGYSFKRLVFLYETLCTMQVEVLAGDSLQTLQQLGAKELVVPASNLPEINAIIHQLSACMKVRVIAETPLARIAKPRPYTRFFQYWKQAEKTVFLPGADQ